MTGTAFIVLRRMRAPLIGIVTMYAISILGLTLISGVDAEGRPTPPMSFFDAFYFISYTATTIGFGEIPVAFSYSQRMWVTFCIYLTVVGWTYAIVTVLSLLQDRAFLQARRTAAFARAVRRIADPFYIIAGYGETGQMLCRALDGLRIAFVVIDRDEDEVNDVDLQDYRRDVPAIAADVCSPEVLLRAGMRQRWCRGVVAITDDDAANLAVAMSVRLLNPRLPVLARAENPEIATNMVSFGTHHVINPFEKFAEYLTLAIRSPGSYQLLGWLTGIPGTRLPPQVEPPRGHWVVAGYGRFGSAVVRQLDEHGMDITIIDPSYQIVRLHECVRGLGTEGKTLEEAGIRRAVGVVAASDNDVNNLSIVVTAKELNPELFVVLRRNRESNRILFDVFGADLTMVPSEIIAHECLALLTTPLLSRFLGVVKEQDDAWADALVEQLRQVVGSLVPMTWTVELDATEAPAIEWHLRRPPDLTLDCLLRDPGGRDDRLDCHPLLLVRASSEMVLPGPDTRIEAGDRILFAGTPHAASRQSLLLSNRNAAEYVLTGRDVSGAWIGRWLRERRHG